MLQLIAIGKTTADAMRKKSLPVAAVCQSPDPTGLKTALNQLLCPNSRTAAASDDTN